MAAALMLGGACLVGCVREPAPASSRAQRRVVSLAPSLTELIYALGAGDRLVGRTDACDYPSEVSAVPVVGGFGAPALEALVAARPTLILDVDLADAAIAQRLAELGLRRERVACRRLADLPGALVRLGELLECPAAADALSRQVAARLAALERTASGTNGPTVFVQVWHDPLMTAGGASFISEAVRLAGGRNLGDAVADRDFFTVSAEWVLARDPAVILCLNGIPDAAAAVQARAAWQSVSAVRDRRVIDTIDPALLTRPTLRVLDGIERLRKALRSQESED